MEVVVPSGEILNLQSDVRKDNTGFDLKQLFIGSEGTLGVITKANLLCVKKDPYQRVLLVKCKSYKEVLDIHKISKNALGKNLSAIEFFDNSAYELVVKNIPGVIAPFALDGDESKYYMLIEIAGTQPLEELEMSLYDELGKVVNLGDCILCENESQAENIWKIRESIAIAAGHMGSFLTYDFSLNVSKWPELIADVRKKTKGLAYTGSCGHIGDGNLHVLVVCLEEGSKEELVRRLEPYAFEWLRKERGSISAEHGIGFAKAEYLGLAKGESTVRYMREIKRVFDPKNILNPYKMFPAGESL